MFSQKLIFKVLLISSLIVSSGCNIFGSGSDSKGSNDLEAKQTDADPNPNPNEDEQPSDTTTTCSSTSVDHSQTVLPEGTRGVSTEIVTCDEGYTKTGDAFEWSCNADGEWVGEACVSLYDCDVDVSNQLSGASSVKSMVDETVDLTCAEGYTASASSVTCSEADGVYSFDVTPACNPVACSELVVDNAASVAAGVFGDETNVNCDAGYMNNKDRGATLTYTCKADGNWKAAGTWSGGASCVQYCDLSVANSENGDYKIAYGEAVYVQCNESFSGSDLVTCTDGVLDTTPVCSSYVVSTSVAPQANEGHASTGFSCDLNDEDPSNDVNIDFPDHSFVMKLKLDSNLKIKLPTVVKNYPEDNADYDDSDDTNFYVDWGNGKCSHITTSSIADDLTHDYSATKVENDIVTVRLIGTVDNLGPDDGTRDFFDGLLIEVVELGSVGWKDLSKAFHSTSNLETFTAKHVDTSEVTSFSGMFRGASNLVELDLSNFNTSNATDMSLMFYTTRLLKSLDLRSFDTSKVTDFSNMFFNSFSSNLEYLDVSSFDTSSGTDFSHMFNGLNFLRKLDVSHFDFSSVSNNGTEFQGIMSFSNIESSLEINMFNFDSLQPEIKAYFTANFLSSFFFIGGDLKINFGSFSFKGLDPNFPDDFMDDFGAVFYFDTNSVTYFCETDDDPTTPGNEIYFSYQFNSCVSP